jgi:hypothetical protein
VRGRNAWGWGNLCARGALPRLVASEGVCVFVLHYSSCGQRAMEASGRRRPGRKRGRDAHHVSARTTCCSVCVCVCARACLGRAPGTRAAAPPGFGHAVCRGQLCMREWVVCGMVVTRRGACVPSRRGERHTACSSWWAWACRGWRVGTPNSASSRSSDLKP